MNLNRSSALRRFSLSKLSFCLGVAWGGAAVWAQSSDLVLAQARTDANPTITLKEVVVSGSRIEQDIDEVPATITTVGGEEITRENPSDLEDLLKYEAGVSVRALPNRASAVFSQTGRAGNEGVNIRGLEGDQVRMQIDGVSLPGTYSSGPYAAGRGETIDPEGYKRVEILRGASSSQYGSDGLAGAVSFLTKDPSDLLTLGKSSQFNVKAGYTSVDRAWQLAPSYAFKGDGVQGLVLASMRRGNEVVNMGSNDAANWTRTTPNPASNRSDYLLAKLQLTPDQVHQFKLTLESIRRENNTDVLSFFGDPSAAATLTDVKVRENVKRDMVKLDYRYAPQNMWYDLLSASVYFQDSNNQQYGYEARSTAPLVRTRDTRYGETTVGGNVQMETHLAGSTSQRLVYGVDVSSTDVTSMKYGYNSSGTAFTNNKAFPDTEYQTFGAFVQDEVNLGAVSVIPGARFESFRLTPKPDAYYRVSNTTEPSTLSGSALSPKLGAIWRVAPMVQPFAQYAHGFRAPKPVQVNGSVTNATYRSVGNPDLKPETSQTFELGLRGRDATRRYSVTFFHSDYKDFITTPYTMDGTIRVYKSVNLTDVVISGFELRGDWAFAPNWTVNAAYAHARGDSRENGTSTPLATIDPDKLVVGLRYDRGSRWGLASHVTAVDRKQRKHDETKVSPPGYVVMDVSGWYGLDKATTLHFGIGNLFDQKYVEWADVRELAQTYNAVDAFTQPGRNFRVSLTRSF